MPTYGYQCNACQQEFSVFQSMKDVPIAECPSCGGSVKRLLYPVGIVFKGSGWYINDSRGPDKQEASKGEETNAKETASESGATETAKQPTPTNSTSETTNSSKA